MKIHLRHSLFAILLAVTVPHSALAATYYWDNNGTVAGYGTAAGTWAAPTTGNTTQGWSTSTTGGTLPGNVTTATTDVINFGNATTGLAAGTITVSGTVSSGNVTFALGSGTILLSGGTITLTAAETITTNNSSDTINSDLAGAGTSLTKAGTGTLTLSGSNTYTGTTTVTTGALLATSTAALPGYNTSGKVVFNGGTVGVQIGGPGWSTADVDTLLTNATKTSGSLGIDTTNGDLTQWTAFTTSNFGSALGLAKFGTGTLTLDQANTFAGDVNFTSGTIIVKNSGAVGTGTKKVVMNNGNSVFKLDGSGGDLTFANTITFQTAGLQAGGTIVNVAGNNAINGPITLNSGAGGTAIQVDGGTLALAGSISIGAGTRSLSLQGAGNGTASGVISANNGVSKNGTGTWTLTGANTYSSGTTIYDGTLVANRSNNTLNPTTSALGNPQSAQNITVGNGGTLKFYAGDTLGGATSTPAATLVIQSGGIVTNNGNNFTTLGPVSLTGGTLTGTGGAIIGYQMYNFAGTVTASNNATSTISGSGTYAGYHLNTNTTFQVDSGSTLNVSGILIDRYNSTGSGGFTKTGAGIMTLSGASANTYTGLTTVSVGELDLNKTAGINAIGGNLTVNGGTAKLLANNQISDSATVTVAGGILDTTASNFTDTVGMFNISNGSLNGGGTITAVTYGLTGGTVTANLGTGTITANSGTTALNGTAAATTINIGGGTLTLGSAGRLASGAAVTLSSGGLTLAGAETVSTYAQSGGTLGGSGTTLTAASYTLTGGTVTANLGTGTITANSGTTALNGTAAATTINIGGGTLTLGSAGRLASGAAVTLASGQLTLAGAETVSTYAQSGGTLDGGGTTLTAASYTLTGGTVTANLGTGTITANSGTTALNGTAAATTINIGGGTLMLGSAGRLASGAAVTLGSGQLTLAGAETVSTYAQSGGTLVGTGITLTSASAYAMQAGTVSANLGGSVGLNKTTGGTVTLTGANTYSGDTTVSAGTLSLGQVNPSNTSSTVSIASGAILDLGFVGTQIVDKLFINGVQQAAGDYTSAHASGRFTGGGTLHVTSAPPGFAAWAASHGFTGGPDAVGADGIKNLMKYALGLDNPAASYPSPGNFTGNLLSFAKGGDAVTAGDVTYAIETSSDLVIWTPATDDITHPYINNSATISYQLPPGSGKIFARLVVIKP